MGIFRPFLGGIKSLEEFQEINHGSDKPFTPADVMTVGRPVLAAIAARKLLNGEKAVFPWVAAMGFSDMEGKPARLIDKIWPDSGWGTTEHGAEWDPIADTAALLIVSAAALRAPRLTLGAKAATLTVVGQEGFKAGWALLENKRHLETTGSHLKLPSSKAGKEAMAEKLSAIGLAIATGDTDNPYVRAGLTAGALYFAASGVRRGEQARRAYGPIIEALRVPAGQSEPVLTAVLEPLDVTHLQPRALRGH